MRRNARGVAKHSICNYPGDGRFLSAAVTVFADDCGITTSADSVEAAVMLDKRDDRYFDEQHVLANMKQNHAIAVRQLSVNGLGSALIRNAIRRADGGRRPTTLRGGS